MSPKSLLAAIEGGGTTFVVAIADSPSHILDRQSVPTTTPDETISRCIEWLKAKEAEQGRAIVSLGVACFGPVDLNKNSSNYGYITTTPKPGWQHTDIVGKVAAAFPGVSLGFETDVNAPAYLEARMGQHGDDVSSVCYVTVGTGIGVGVVVDGKPVHGFMHPEAGHAIVARHERDSEKGFKGLCPYHGFCLEGMAASGAIAARKGIERSQLLNVTDDDEVWDITAYYLAMLCYNLVVTVSPQVIVLGGGVLKRTCLYGKVRKAFLEINNGYCAHPKVEQLIKKSVYEDPGLVSAVLLASDALQEGQ